VKEKVSCHGLSQLTDFAPLAPALARFGRVGCEATNQKVGSSNPPGRTTLHLVTNLRNLRGFARDAECHEVDGAVFEQVGKSLHWRESGACLVSGRNLGAVVVGSNQGLCN